MFRIIARLCVLTCCCLSVTPGAFAEEGSKAKPEPNANNCSYLNIYLKSTTGLPATVYSDGVACDHGDLAKIEPSPTDTKLVILKQSYTYGPDCVITIKSGNSTAVLRAQQNYCGYEAGKVDPRVITGPAVIDRYENGSYDGSQPGQVWVSIH